LDGLSRLRLIERHVPGTEKPERSKRSQYRLRDPLFRFWFRFLYGSSDRYDQFGDEAYDRLVEPEMADFVAPAFEQLCCEALWTLYDETPIADVGQWWYQDHKIGVVGLTHGETLVVGECKYQESPLNYSALAPLKTHAEELRWQPSNVDTRTVGFALFSRSGFTDSVGKSAAKYDDLRLYTIDDLVNALRE
jgi:Archaea bacterial proteins of unknown function.